MTRRRASFEGDGGEGEENLERLDFRDEGEERVRGGG